MLPEQEDPHRNAQIVQATHHQDCPLLHLTITFCGVHSIQTESETQVEIDILLIRRRNKL